MQKIGKGIFNRVQSAQVKGLKVSLGSAIGESMQFHKINRLETEKKQRQVEEFLKAKYDNQRLMSE